MADNTKKYIDVAYLQEFWARIKNLPSNANLTVEGSTLSGTKHDLISHLDELYKKIAAADAEAEKHTTLTTGTSNGITVTQDTTVTDHLEYKVELDSVLLAKINKLIEDEKDYVTKKSVKTKKGATEADEVTLSTWGDSGSIEVDGKTFTVSLPSNPIANIEGGESAAAGVKVSIDKDTLAPTVTVTGATYIEEGTDAGTFTNPGNVVTGEEVAKAINAAKALQEKIDITNQVITGTGEATENEKLIKGTITVQSSATTNGTVDLSLTPKITESTATATALATKEYVDEAVTGKNISYSFKETAVELTDADGDKKYTGTLTLQKTDNDTNTTTEDAVSIEIDGTEFLKDSYLKSAAIAEDGKTLVMTMNVGRIGTATNEVTVNLAQFIDAYNPGAGIKIDADKNISVKTKEGDYITTSTDGVILNTGKLQGYADTEAKAGDNNIATKGYVDEQIGNAQVSATVTGSPVNAFGGEGSITIKTSKVDATGKTLTVKLPSFEAGTSTNGNVSVAIANDGKITTTTVEQAGSGDYATKTALAQAGYVDEKVAGVVLTAGTGIDITKNVVSAITTGYVTKGTTGLNIDSDKITDVTEGGPSTGEDANLVTKGYVDKMVGDYTVSIITSEDNLSIVTPTDGTDGKDFDINVPTADWDETKSLFTY